MASTAELRALMRRAAEARSRTATADGGKGAGAGHGGGGGTGGSKAALTYTTPAGAYMCRVCHQPLGYLLTDAVWAAHAVIGSHKAALRELAAKAGGGGGAGHRREEVEPPPEPVAAAAPTPLAAVAATTAPPVAPAPALARAAAPPIATPSSSTPTSTPAAIPAGFFDDAEADARARGLDPRAMAAAAKEQAWAEFSSFADEVTATDAAATGEEEERYRVERDMAAAVETMAYKSRLEALKWRVQAARQGRATGQASGAAAQEEEEEEEEGDDLVPGMELVQGGVTFLTSLDGGGGGGQEGGDHRTNPPMSTAAIVAQSVKAHAAHGPPTPVAVVEGGVGMKRRVTEANAAVDGDGNKRRRVEGGSMAEEGLGQAGDEVDDLVTGLMDWRAKHAAV